MNPNIKCPKPCEQAGKYIYCYWNSGKYTFVNCKLYQQQLELERNVQENILFYINPLNLNWKILKEGQKNEGKIHRD